MGVVMIMGEIRHPTLKTMENFGVDVMTIQVGWDLTSLGSHIEILDVVGLMGLPYNKGTSILIIRLTLDWALLRTM